MTSDVNGYLRAPRSARSGRRMLAAPGRAPVAGGTRGSRRARPAASPAHGHEAKPCR